MNDATERAIQARHLLDEGLFAECLSKLEANYIEQWRESRTTEARENLHRLVNLIDQLKADLRSVITTGDIEAVKKQDKPRGIPWLTK